MTDEPQTRNTIEADAKRLAEAMLKTIGNDAEWRTAQAMSIAHNTAKLEHLTFVVEQHLIIYHAEIQEIKQNARTISSSVTTEQLNSRYTLSQMVGGFIILCGALGGLIGFIAWAISHPTVKS